MEEVRPEPRLTGPRIHLNGTSRAELERQYERAVEALSAAIEALGDSAPNARDYYPQGPGAYQRAVGEHAHRVSRLRAVQGELYWLRESLDEGDNTPRPSSEPTAERCAYVQIAEGEIPEGLRWDVASKGMIVDLEYADDPTREQTAALGSRYRRMKVHCDGSVAYWRRCRG